MTGVTLMLGGGLALGQLTGNLFALGSAVAFAGHALFLRLNRQSDMLPAVLYAGLFGMLFGLVALGTQGISPRVPPRDLTLALAMGVVQLGGGLVLYTRATSRRRSSSSSPRQSWSWRPSGSGSAWARRPGRRRSSAGR
jgi:drug/metabolite transporter (DMT)-like permease